MGIEKQRINIMRHSLDSHNDLKKMAQKRTNVTAALDTRDPNRRN
jgi:hypothetical protein